MIGFIVVCCCYRMRKDNAFFLDLPPHLLKITNGMFVGANLCVRPCNFLEHKLHK